MKFLLCGSLLHDSLLFQVAYERQLLKMVNVASIDKEKMVYLLEQGVDPDVELRIL